MNIWETGPFEDDLAIDWLEDLHDSDAMAFFRHCLDLTDTNDLHHLACIGVLCSSAMIAGLLSDSPALPLPPSATDWLADHQALKSEAPSLIVDAIGGLRQVLAPESEMAVRWQDRGEAMYAQWRRDVEQIMTLLQTVQSQVR